MMGPVSAGDPLGLSGSVLHEQYRVGELADDSRRAYLYKGTEVATERAVALKFLKIPPAFAAEPFLKRFRHETRLHYALSLASPHIVRVLAGGTALLPGTEARVPFSVLEWLHGRTLAADFAERRAHWGKGRSVPDAIRLLDPAVLALATAHAHGVVHREVTPANLFLHEANGTSELKVLDFGLAKVMNDMTAAEGGRAATVDMGPLAAPIYAAPEQFSREVGEVGPATDLYSLMMIFLEALRDRVVMEESSSPLAVRVLDRTKRPTPRSLGIDVGDNLELAVTEAVALRPADRPQNISEFWERLKKAALKDARAVAISAPPSLRSRTDGMPDDDETEVQIDLSFLRPSQAPTVPHPEPETLSRPTVDDEPLSTTGELFAMEIPPTKVSGPPPAQPPAAGSKPHGKTLLSAGQSAPATRADLNVTMPTLVSAAPKPAISLGRDAPQVSSASPFELRQQTGVPPTPVMPSSPHGATKVIPFAQPPAQPEPFVGMQQPSYAPMPQPPVPSMPQPPQKANMPWLTMAIVFVVVTLGLTIVAVLALR